MTTGIDEGAELLRADPLFLDRCQVDTPLDIVRLVWSEVQVRRPDVGHVVEFGAGDGRFAQLGSFSNYTGYEVDQGRCAAVGAPAFRLVPQCAFSHALQDADVCIGNPPFVRNQDLPVGWREMAASEIRKRTGVTLSGLANAWQYFLMLGLWSVKSDGLVAMVLPFEWVSRPAAAAVRTYITTHDWGVDVYRLPDGVFSGVLTAASITIVDKRKKGPWRYFRMTDAGTSVQTASPTGTDRSVLPYSKALPLIRPFARRGLSPGTQQVLTLNEAERLQAGLHIQKDVVRCVTSLRGVPAEVTRLTRDAFDEHLLRTGAKCWLIRTDREPSPRLRSYLEAVAPNTYQTATCLGRKPWWGFAMPPRVATILISQAFRPPAPKAVLNDVRAHAVGGVAGVYNVAPAAATRVIATLCAADLPNRLVPYAKEMRKIEINQINSLLAEITASDDA